MRLLFTGSSGFLGNSIYSLLKNMYDVTTVGLMPDDNYTINIAKEIPAFNEVYDIVLHAAGKLIRYPKRKRRNNCFSM